MTSKLASLARVVFSAKAAAARSAPAAIVGPLQKLFGIAGTAEPEKEQVEQQQEQQEILQSTSEPGVVSALVARAVASAAAPAAAITPIENPSARRELREFQQDYYRRAVAVPNRRDFVQDPDLSIPVNNGEDEYLYLAQ